MSSPSPELSCDQPMKNDEAGTSEPRRKRQRSESTKPSSVSMKSSRSLMQPPVFSGGTVTSDPRRRKRQRSESPEPSSVSLKSNRSLMQPQYSVMEQ
ncbi:hypothetical protein G5714_000118 [Onychostoma macrolepis]|uniref:Uncharacterized protein n=1 Tax=Onychostoma macrolepis TaxID=369639 RepID=A0A7J6DFL6_9TELE|nr:hypothetical protein G5714_000118 [Onychostoma macrolepis]